MVAVLLRLSLKFLTPPQLGWVSMPYLAASVSSAWKWKCTDCGFRGCREGGREWNREAVKVEIIRKPLPSSAWRRSLGRTWR